MENRLEYITGIKPGDRAVGTMYRFVGRKRKLVYE